MKAGSGHTAIVFLAGTAFGPLAPVPVPTPKPKPPSESERIKTLSEEERQWLTEFVAAIILDEEKKGILQLEAPYQREQITNHKSQFTNPDWWEVEGSNL